MTKFTTLLLSAAGWLLSVRSCGERKKYKIELGSICLRTLAERQNGAYVA